MRNNFIPYDYLLIPRAKVLRKQSTLGEILLWKCIQHRKVNGYKFIRQKPLLHYIVDFYCPEINLALEVDGSVHEETDVYDYERQKALERLGVHFIRFYDQDIRKNPDGAVLIIEKWIRENI